MRWLHLVLATFLVSGCAAAPSKSTAPQQADNAPRKEAPTAERNRFYSNPAKNWSTAAPGVAVTFFDQRDPDRAQLMTRPAELELDKLPRGTIPEPLDAKDAPARLPASVAPSELKVERPYGWSNDQSSATLSIEGKLVRLQIGNVGDEFAASERAYRTCGTQMQGSALLPARWMTLAPNTMGKVRLRVVDAWFDSNSCQASVVRTTVIEPAPLLNGLVYAFRSRCKDCKERDSLVLITPPVTTLAHGIVGKSARVSTGSFVLARVALRRGAAASLGGPVGSHMIDQWYDALGGSGVRGDAVIGVDVSHAVAEDKPLAIAYATIIRS